jgi:hypothetical protein
LAGRTRGGGSIAIVAAARAAFLVAPDPANPRYRILAQTKGNYAKRQPSLRFTLEYVEDFQTCRVVWINGPCEVTADALLQPPDDGKSKVEEEADFLQAVLAPGEQMADEVYKLAGKHRIFEATLKRAKKQLGVTSREVRDLAGMVLGWFWSLPQPCAPGDSGEEEPS